MAINYSIGANDIEIQAFKTKFGFDIDLESEYLQFLKERNGLFLSDETYCDIPFSMVDNGFISFQELYGINLINKNWNIDRLNNNYLDEIKSVKNVIIIGGDPGGNKFLLSTKNDNVKVFYWDRGHIHFDDNYDYKEVDEEGNLYIVANSFSEFIKMIKDNIEGTTKEVVNQM